MNNEKRTCIHCGNELAVNQEEFCCLGCETAYKIINKLGFSNYYNLRKISATERKLKPEAEDDFDISDSIKDEGNGIFSLSLMIQGLHCAACVWLIESMLRRDSHVISARVNLSKKILNLRWKGSASDAKEVIHPIIEIGYKLLPFDEEILKTSEKNYSDSILLALAVAGFGAGNVMLFSFAIWFSDTLQMGAETRNLFHFFSSLIAIPVIIFSARPFFISAWKSLRSGFPNMDLPVSMAIFLACVVSLLETFRGSEHVYFDSAVMLTFFLLIGRFLDLKARKKAFDIATEFSLIAASYGRVEEGGKVKILPSKRISEGMILIVAAGEKIAADGVVIDGESEVDSSLITGESLPKLVQKTSEVFAGMINLGNSLRIRVTKSAQNSVLAEIIRLSEGVEDKKNKYLRLSERVSRIYTPAVHALAFLTFCVWYFLQNSGFENALVNATTVLIITCPCALALAIPIVQTIAISHFTRRGILVKSGEVLEKMRNVETFIFDKTGSLTIGHPKLQRVSFLSGEEVKSEQKNLFLSLAASLSQKSRHPISRALSEAYSGDLQNLEVKENHGFGLSAQFSGKEIRLGRKEFCGIKSDFKLDENSLRCFIKFGEDEVVFLFDDELKTDAKEVVSQLKNSSKKVILLSGDNEKIVAKTAQSLGITEFYFEQTPISKVEILEKIKSQLPKNSLLAMIGDGLNDTPSLALADVSISFSKATDIAQNTADVVIQGEKLAPLLDLKNSSSRAMKLMKQNLLIALFYNLFAVPFAAAGYIVPLFAALAMSSSSLLVLLNSLRMKR